MSCCPCPCPCCAPTLQAFPQRWKLTVPGVLDLTLTATFPDQEVMTMLVGAFWEGELEHALARHGRARVTAESRK